MKIAFAVDNLRPTGIVRVVRNIAIALAQEENAEISIICTGRENTPENYIPENITVYNLDICRYGNRKKYFRYVGALRNLFSGFAPDVLVVAGMEHVPFYALAAKMLPKTKCIAWEHRNFSAGPRFRLEWLGRRLALKHWDGVLTITKRDKKQYRDYRGSKDGIYQIYNLTDFSGKRIPYKTDSKKIMSCGYLSPVKGYDLLLTVAETVFRKKPDWSWDIYGKGALQAELEQEIKTRGLENNVCLKGYAPNVQELYGDYAFFVLTSRAEGMGMVLIEAQKAGLPVVSFDILCGPSDVITDEQNGYLIPAFDTDQMAEKIMELIDDGEKRKAFSNRSEIHHAEFEKEVILEKWKEMLGLPG